MNTEYDYKEEIAYVVERAVAEGSAVRYLEGEYKNKRNINELVSDIIISAEQFFDKIETEKISMYTTEDEHNYIAEKTGYSIEIIEVVRWFYECYKMTNDCIEYCGICKKCGHDTLYIREDDGEMYCSVIECAKCIEQYTYDEMLEDDSMVEYDVNERLPLYKEEEIPLKDVNKVNTSYIIKAATGYRKGIWRKIQISAAATLDDLSSAVLDAFEFDHSHLYAFYMDQKLRCIRGVPTFYSPLCGYELHNADRQMLENFNFEPKQRFLFLYDFGDEWHFTMTVEKVIDEITPMAFVVKSSRESALQYGVVLD